MTLLEDARAFSQSLEVKGECPICGAYRPDDGVPDDHEPDCQMVTLMPKIVAALEAAAAAVDEWGHPKRCPFCGPRLQLRPALNHDSVCPWVALVKAMKD